MKRASDRLALDPGNVWAWYELCKANEAHTEADLRRIAGVGTLPQAAIEGLAEFTGREITPLKGAC